MLTGKSVRIGDVAAAAGVSKTLVSYALNGRPGVGEATRAHIIRTAEEMGWTPSMRGRALSDSRAYAVGLVFNANPEQLANDQYFTSLMAGIQSTLSASSYSLVTEVVANIEAEGPAYTRLAREGRVDGMIVVGLQNDDARFDILEQSRIPFVSLGRPPRRTTMPVMLYDETDAIVAVLDHLTSLGHRRIAQVVGPQSSGSARLRRELYQRAITDHGLDGESWLEADYTAAGGRAATETLLTADEPPSAIIYSSDLMAIAGMSYAYSRGFKLPDDISIVGWDDHVTSQYVHPALSTVSQHPFEDGRQAALLLLEAIDGSTFADTIWTANPVFIPRESTGPARPRRVARART
jgi:LacI family repressor for deo operon, udp, cdd, tsx, nupC, and nupG